MESPPITLRKENMQSTCLLRKYYATGLFLIITIFSVLLGSCGSDSHNRGMRILVSGNTFGLIEPCDCEVGPLGGLAKRYTLFNDLDHDHSALKFDTGGLINDIITPDEYGAILNANLLLEYDGIVPAPVDSLLFGAIAGIDSFPILDNEGPFTYEINGIRLEILAFSEFWLPGTIRDNTPSSATENSDRSSIKAWLVHLSDGEIEYLLSILPKPDFIIAGPCDWAAPTPDTLSGVPVFRAGVDGIDIIEISLEVVDGYPIITPRWYTVGTEIVEADVIVEVLQNEPD